MNNNIKVTVDYELPSTSKFDALIEQYLSAKAITETTEETMTPLIEAGGKARYDAICEQLKVVANQFKKIVLLKNNGVQAVRAYYHKDEYGRCSKEFVMRYASSWNGVEIVYGRESSKYTRDFLDWNKNAEDLLSLNGLVTNWNDYDIIDKLQKECNQILDYMIKNQQAKTQTIADTLNKIKS